MPVKSVIVVTKTLKYEATCLECPNLRVLFTLKHNADDFMRGHRTLKHSYRPSLVREVKSGSRPYL